MDDVASQTLRARKGGEGGEEGEEGEEGEGGGEGLGIHWSRVNTFTGVDLGFKVYGGGREGGGRGWGENGFRV